MSFDLLNVALAILVLGGAAAVATRPVFALYAYLSVLFFFPNVSWGVATGVQVMNLYTRGTGYFYFSIINLYLYALFAMSIVQWGRRNAGIEACNLRKYLFYFFALLLVHATVGTMLGIPLKRIFTQMGFTNIVNMLLLTTIVIRAVDTPREMTRLANLVMALGAVRGLYGMGRFLFYGGDVANVYENVEKIGIKLTFFDINEGIIACLAAFIAAWRFFDPAGRKSIKPLYAAIVVLEVLVVAFSYRRTGWGGMALASALFCFMQPMKVRLPLFAGGVVAGGFGLTVLIAQRFSKVSDGRGVFDMLFHDVKADRKEGRFAELYNAFQTVSENPLLGAGSWGGYGPSNIEFMHSGLLHVWLKAGLIGLIPFCMIFIAFVYFCMRAGRTLRWSDRAVFGAGIAGAVFTVPAFLMGTPIIEYRTMQMVGFCLALPYVAYGCTRGLAREPTPVAANPAHGGFALARQKLFDAERRQPHTG